MLGRSAEVGWARPSPRDGDLAPRPTDGDQVRRDVVGRREDLIGGVADGVAMGDVGDVPEADPLIGSTSGFSAPAGYRFPREVIAVGARWYLRYGLSYRDVEELLAERGVEVDHVTIYRWAQTFTAECNDAARDDGLTAGNAIDYRMSPDDVPCLTAFGPDVRAVADERHRDLHRVVYLLG